MTQPAAPSSTDTPATAPTSERSPVSSWIDTLLGRNVPEPEPAPESVPAATDAKPHTSDEVQRLVDGEMARRDGQRLTVQQEEERRQLRRTDPFAFAALLEQEEQEEQARNAYGQQVAGVAQTMDRALLDPLIERVPERERAKLFEAPGAGEGIDGRAALAKSAIDTIEREAEARGARLALEGRWPPAGRQQPQERARGTKTPSVEPPAGQAVSDFLRGQLGIYRGPEGD